jgi:hypothetical protein
MVARVKSTRFGCMLAASLFVLVLAGCGDVSESGSSQMAHPSKKSPPTETAESHAAGGRSADCKPTQPDMLGPFYEPGAPVRTSVGSGVCTLWNRAFSRRVQADLQRPHRVLAGKPQGGLRRCTPGYGVCRPERKVSLGEQRARLLRRKATPHPRSGEGAWLRGAGYATLPAAWSEEGELRSGSRSGVR